MAPKSDFTEQDLLQDDEENYMNENQLLFFKSRLTELHEKTLARIESAKEEMVRPIQFSDDGDRASFEEQANTALRIVDREQKLLSKIAKSLDRIRTKEFGYCLESGEPIGLKRLLARPTAEYCTEVKERMERRERQFKE